MRRSVEDHDYAPLAQAAGSVEPFRKPDHKSKKHPRPRKGGKSNGGAA